MYGPINREIRPGEFAVILTGEYDVSLEQTLRFYRSIEIYLRRPENMGRAFNLHLEEFKSGSSEARFTAFWKGLAGRGRKARELEERQTRAMERMADAQERSAKTLEDEARKRKSDGRWMKVGVGATVIGGIASVIATGIAAGLIEIPRERDGSPKTDMIIIVAHGCEAQKIAPPVRPQLDSKPGQEAFPADPPAARQKEREAEQKRISGHNGNLSLRVTGEFDGEDFITQFGNRIPVSPMTRKNFEKGHRYFAWFTRPGLSVRTFNAVSVELLDDF